MCTRLRITSIVCAALLGAVCAPVAHGKCKLAIVGELPVDTAGNRIVTAGTLNGQSIRILMDTGTHSSFVWESAARRFGLPLMARPLAQVYGVGGRARTSTTVVKHMQVGNFYASDMTFVVIGDTSGGFEHTDFVLGEEAFSHYDIEFDLAHGEVRLMHTDGCDPDQVSYWSDTFSLADMGASAERIETTVVVNGKPMTAILDTGAPRSFITHDAAERVGVAPWREGVAPVTRIGGMGSKREDTWVGTFTTFTLGDESVKNVRLLISDLFRADRQTTTGSNLPTAVQGPSMLLGCDFLLAHRMLVLRRQQKLVFTYNGGPIFAPRPPEAPAAASPSAAPPAKAQ
jgi:predicted aspartyl protease